MGTEEIYIEWKRKNIFGLIIGILALIMGIWMLIQTEKGNKLLISIGFISLGIIRIVFASISIYKNNKEKE